MLFAECNKVAICLFQIVLTPQSIALTFLPLVKLVRKSGKLVSVDDGCNIELCIESLCHPRSDTILRVLRAFLQSICKVGGNGAELGFLCFGQFFIALADINTSLPCKHLEVCHGIRNDVILDVIQMLFAFLNSLGIVFDGTTPRSIACEVTNSLILVWTSHQQAKILIEILAVKLFCKFFMLCFQGINHLLIL